MPIHICFKPLNATVPAAEPVLIPPVITVLSTVTVPAAPAVAEVERVIPVM